MSEADYSVPTVRVGSHVVLDHSGRGQRCSLPGHRVEPVYTAGDDLIGLTCVCGRKWGCRVCPECGQVFLVGGQSARTFCTEACRASAARERARERSSAT